MLKLVVGLLVSFNSFALAAICDCDAPPSCGRSRPSVCGARAPIERNVLLGKGFVKEDGPGEVESLYFLGMINRTTLAVDYGIQIKAVPWGDYYAVMTSNNSFNLMNRRGPNDNPVLVEQFTFSGGSGDVDTLESSKGEIYHLVR